MRRGGYGAIGSDTMQRTFGQNKPFLHKGSGRCTMLGGKSFRPDPTPRPLVWRTGAVTVGAHQLSYTVTGADASALALLPVAVTVIGGGSRSGHWQQTDNLSPSA